MKINKPQGFTLIELLIVIAIVALLSSLAFSNYGDNVISAKRTDGRNTILNTSTSLEKCKAIYGAYNNANCSVGAATIPSPEGHYNIAFTTLTATTFILTASPAGAQTNDTECTSIILNELGQQTGTGSDPTTCW